MVAPNSKTLQEKPIPCLSNGQKTQLLGLLQHWKEKGELESKLAFILSDEGKRRQLNLALHNGAISQQQFNRENARIAFGSIPESVFKPLRSSSDNNNHIAKSPKEIDEAYHAMAGECYPGIMRVKCGIYGTNKAFLMVRIRTSDIEFDASMREMVGSHFKGELKSGLCGNYYEISAYDLPRNRLSLEKAELDEIAWDFLTFKEEHQGLGDSNTSDFKKSIQNPDYKKD